MRNRYGKIIAACGIVALLNLGSAAVATAQSITDLGATDATVTLGFSFHSGQMTPAVTAINNVGQVVGQAVTANGDEHAALWQKDQQGNYIVTDLGTLGGAGTFSRAFGINAAGQVVGESTTDDGFEHAVLWQKDPQGNYLKTVLPTLGGAESAARAINDAGQVAGFAVTANGEKHAVLWQKDSQGNYSVTDIGTAGGVVVFSDAFGINAAGQVVGVCTHACIWQNGQKTELVSILGPCGIVGIADCGFGQAFAINAGGQVVGYSTATHAGINVNSATLWQNGATTDIGALGVAATPHTFSVALGINAAGQVVGTSNTLGPHGEVDGIPHALLWQSDSQGALTITDIDTLLPPGSGWKTLISASAINDQGQIVGLGVFSDGLIHRYLLGPSIELLDPVPELLSGPAVTTDKELLASKGRPVLGVAADGVTQLVIRIPAKSVGDQFTLTVLNAQQAPSFAKDEDGAVADVNNPSFSSSVTVTAVDTAKGPMAFALYLAPKDFVRNCGSSLCQSYSDVSSREINVQINGSSTFPIKIVRSPVLLIHGLWGQQSGWDGFKLVTDPRFKVFRADYKETNGESFEVNTSNVEAELDLDLREFKSVSKVAAVQFDLVTHSMGGLLARKLATLPLYERSTNYRQGDIHKLITLDTPHLGSQFANRLEASSPLCKFIFNRIGKKIGGAVRDLQYGSPAIQQLLELKTPIKARLIAGQATKLQEDTSTAIFVGVPPLNAVNAVCGPLLTLPGGFPEVFQTQDDPDGHSDLIVSVVSQVGKTIAVGRQDPPADSPYIGIEHTKVPVLFPGPSPLDDADIGQRVIDLLNTPVSIIDFGDILP